MSVQLYRYIEIKYKPTLRCDIVKSLDEVKELIDGKIVKIYDDIEKHYKYFIYVAEIDDEYDFIPSKWEEYYFDETPKWELLTYYSPANRGYCYDNENTRIFGTGIYLKTHKDFYRVNDSIKNNYLGGVFSEDNKLKNRGIPKDICQDTKDSLDMFERDSFDHTYVYLSEWETLEEKETLVVERNLEKLIYNSGFTEIKNILLDKNEENAEKYELEEIYRESLENLKGLQNEISIINFLVSEIYGYIDSEDIRITYSFVH